MFGLTGQEADIKSLEQTVVLKLQEISKLKAELDDLNSPVQLSEWQKLQAENDRLQAELQRHKFAIGILYKCFREKEPTPSAWVDEAFALKEVK